MSVSKDEMSKLRIQLTYDDDFKQEGNDLNESTDYVSEVVKAYFRKGVDIIMERNRGVGMLAKILNLDDSATDYSQTGGLVLIVKITVDFFEITLIEMVTYKCIFEYHFKHSNPIEDDIHVTPTTEINPIHKLDHVKIHMLDAIKHLNSVHVQENVVSNHISILEKRQ